MWELCLALLRAAHLGNAHPFSAHLEVSSKSLGFCKKCLLKWNCWRSIVLTATEKRSPCLAIKQIISVPEYLKPAHSKAVHGTEG